MPWRRPSRQTSLRARAGPAAAETADPAARTGHAATKAQGQLLAAAEAAFLIFFLIKYFVNQR